MKNVSVVTLLLVMHSMIHDMMDRGLISTVSLMAHNSEIAGARFSTMTFVSNMIYPSDGIMGNLIGGL